MSNKFNYGWFALRETSGVTNRVVGVGRDVNKLYRIAYDKSDNFVLDIDFLKHLNANDEEIFYSHVDYRSSVEVALNQIESKKDCMSTVVRNLDNYYNLNCNQLNKVKVIFNTGTGNIVQVSNEFTYDMSDKLLVYDSDNIVFTLSVDMEDRNVINDRLSVIIIHGGESHDELLNYIKEVIPKRVELSNSTEFRSYLNLFESMKRRGN